MKQGTQVTTGSRMASSMSGATKNLTVVNQKERLILHFHGLGPTPDWVHSEERVYWCKEDRFKSILDSICVLSQVVPIQLTFDDGNISDALIALPALVDRGQVASFFVCAGRIGLPGYLGGSALNEIVSGGMEIGSHGWGHVDWRRVDDKALDLEIDGARKKIADILGRDIDKVAVPFGSYDRRVLHRLRRSEIKAVFTSDGGRAPLTGWILPREVFRTSWDDNVALYEMATHPLSMKARIRRTVVRLIKRLR
jgi:peptidoglycan/xylan/chitin deacetylase (PgdA/CDA1 family)